MTSTYDNAAFLYDASTLSYEGVASFTQVLSFSLTPALARTVTVGVGRAATASVSTALVREAALTRLFVGAVSLDVVAAATRTFAYAVNVSAGVTRAVSKSLTAGVTAAGSIIVAFPLYLDWVVSVTAAKAAQISKAAFPASVAMTPTRTLSAGLTSPYSVSLSGSLAKIGAKTLESTVNTALAAARSFSLAFTYATAAGATLARTFGWTTTGTITNDSPLTANGVKVMETTATTSGTGTLEALPTNEGAARDIARDDTHDEAVLTYDRYGRQLYLPVRPTSTL